jgi:RNA-directed DNA polymerase
MTADNRRREAVAEANAEDVRENRAIPMHSTMADKAPTETSILPREDNPHIATIERVVSDHNIQKAIKAVKSNKGAPGIDGITTKEIDQEMCKSWERIKQEIVQGTYRPSPVRRVEIPKPDGKGLRQLGIPTVMDRIIQQAIHQELGPVFDPTFSPFSYGFRPNRSTHQAITQAKDYIQQGYEWVVDIDLEKFFDTVNHDMLMARIAKRVKDKKLLLLIRRYLQAGVMEQGLVKPSEEGTPQGGPLSPLLSNIILDDFDKTLEERGLRFVRYADDCNIYVKTERAGHRVMEATVRYLTQRLKLKVNKEKSAVDEPSNRKFLGFTFMKTKEGQKIAVHKSRIKRLKDKIRKATKKMRGREVKESIRRQLMPITRGWANYFGKADVKGIFKELDGWIRRKIRSIIWRQWKTGRTRYKRLVALGISRDTARNTAYSNRGPWRMARSQGMHKAVSNMHINKMGYIPMEKIAIARS